jgi:ribonuclease HI
MKSLKFDHGQAEQIRRGAKTATWRAFDDKDISVNDVIDIVDRVTDDKPQTWQSLGRARIDSVIEKRLGEVTAEEIENDGEHASMEDMLRHFRERYGDTVTARTPIKIIHFTMLPEAEAANTGDEKTTILTELKLYADGGSRGNPGPSASGYVLTDLSDNLIVKKSIYLGITTNNQAEYQALKLGLEEAKKMHIQTVHVYMDSLLVINQMRRIFNVKNRDLWPIHEATKQLADSFAHITFMHVPREFNKLADAAVNEALDARTTEQ